MVTLQQLKKGARVSKKHKTRSPAMKGCPQLRGVVVRMDIVKPKKPNSAHRKTAKVHLTNNKKVIAYIPGIGHNVSKFTEVMIRGGRVPDLPGVRYHLMRQKLSFNTLEHFGRRARRSKFGVKKYQS